MTSGNANYDKARAACLADLEDMKKNKLIDQETAVQAMQRTEAYMTKLETKLTISMAALSALGNMETSGGGQASQMAFHAREVLKMIKDLDK